jgi:hypothetical protein
MKALAVIPLAVLLAACGSASKPKAADPLTLGPAPKTGKISPPPAWIETKAGKSWLGSSTYCWQAGDRGVCADAVAPSCELKGIPKLNIAEGETVHAHLGYDADEASVDNAKAELDGRTVSWQVMSSGPFSLFTKGKKGDASYVACARFG